MGCPSGSDDTHPTPAQCKRGFRAVRYVLKIPLWKPFISSWEILTSIRAELQPAFDRKVPASLRQSGTTQRSTAQHSTAQHSTAQHSTAQHSSSSCSSSSCSSRCSSLHLDAPCMDHKTHFVCMKLECCSCYLSQAFTKVTLPLHQVWHNGVPYKQKIT